MKPPARWLCCLTLAAGCTSAGAAGPGAMSEPSVAVENQGSPVLVPAGFGTLRQEDIGLRAQLVGGVTARAVPLDESVIRLLSPDSYRALHEQVQGRAAQLREIARRYGYERYSVWRLTFFGGEQGEARFSPQEVIITNAGRDFRPLDLVPLTPGFGEQRLQQRAQQSALYVFDGALDVNQPELTIAIEGVRDDSWGRAVLPRIERERSLVRSRASRASPATPPRPGSTPP